MARLSDGGATTTVSYAALDGAKNRLNALAAQFQNTAGEVGTRHDQALAGAGEFRADLELGAVKFLIGWREAFTVCSESAGLIAANTDNYQLNFKAVDVDQQVKVTI
jgi:hypothetical protein